MKKKFLIFDLDGTLVDPETKELYKGVPQFIKKMSEWYTMFVSTRSSDDRAREVLKNGGIYDYFEAVMGSTTMEKSPQHVEVFEMVTANPNFYQKAYFIGDGDIDRQVAYDSGLPFIKIGIEGKDRYETDSVLHIEELLKKVR